MIKTFKLINKVGTKRSTTKTLGFQKSERAQFACFVFEDSNLPVNG